MVHCSWSLALAVTATLEYILADGKKKIGKENVKDLMCSLKANEVSLFFTYRSKTKRLQRENKKPVS